MKVTCRKTETGIEYNYSGGGPKDDFDLVIYYKANSDKDVSEIADMLDHVSKFIRQWKYSKKFESE